MATKFGENLRNARMNAGLSQQGLADQLSIVAANTVSKWENGSNEPGIDTQKLISEILGISLDELIKGTVYLKPDVREKLKTIPQIKLNRCIYAKSLPKCELEPYKNSEMFYEFYETDEENTFIQYLMDFGGAYNLEDAIGNNGTPEMYAKIESLYKNAWDNGNGLYEAGVNLFRFWLLRDIEEQRKGNETWCTEEMFLLLNDLIGHDLFYCGFEEIVSFYRALFQVYGLYCGSIEFHKNKKSYKEQVNEFMYSGYKEMIVLADKEGNSYAKQFVDGIDNDLIKSARESLKDVSAFEYWNNGHELTEEEKAYLDYINSLEEIFDEIEEDIYKLN